MIENPYSLTLFNHDHAGIHHGSFTRHGGVSLDPYSSNNISFGVGDTHNHVFENRAICKTQLGVRRMISAHQVHGDSVYIPEHAIHGDCVASRCDALVTNRPGLGLLIGHADCQPVLLYDPIKRVVAAIHSGWRGSVLNIIAKTVSVMTEKYGCTPMDIHGAIGPSLGPCCAEFVHFKHELPSAFWHYEVGDRHFDFWAVGHDQLEKAGIKRENIAISGICTSCSDDFFSYRRARREGDGVTGRNGTIIVLK